MKQIIDGIHYYTRESDAKEGIAVIPPPGYDPAKPHEMWVVVHGVGERGSGDLDALQNVALGYDYDGPGPLPRQYPIASAPFRAWCAVYGQIAVIVNYPTNFDPTDFDYVLDTVIADFNVNKAKIGLIGFSWGGREVMRYITSSMARASRLAVAIVCAPVNPGGNLQNIVDARLQVIATTFQEDPTVSPTNVKAIVAGLNKLNPEFPPYYIEFPGKAHGGFSEMLSGNHTLVPQSMFDYLENTSTANRLPYPSNRIVKPTDPQPPLEPMTAKASYTGAGPTYSLNGRQSTGYTWVKWTVIKVPDEVNPWAPMIKGAGSTTATFTPPLPGEYVIEFLVMDANGKPGPKDTLTITYGAAPKTFAGFDSATDLITWSDGSTEPGSARYEAGKWVVKDAAGQPVTM